MKGNSSPAGTLIFPAMWAVAGVLIIAGSVVVPRCLRKAYPTEPGKLVAKQDMLTLQSPSEKPYRSMSLLHATFEVTNVGGAPVRILEAKSSCGCATPDVHPTTIPPGGAGVVEVKAAPRGIGERIVSVTLRTDSVASPEVVLRMRVVGNRRPPYLSSVYGELTYEGDISVGEPRSITATTLELAATKPMPPRVESDLQILEFGPPTLLEETAYDTPGVVLRRYSYEVKPASSFRENAFVGVVELIDPWDPAHRERLTARGTVLPPLRAIPARVVLHAKDGNGPSIKMLVVSKEPAPGLIVMKGEESENPLDVSQVKTLEDNRRSVFNIGLKSGPVREGTYQVVVQNPSTADRVVIPVSVVGGNP